MRYETARAWLAVCFLLSAACLLGVARWVYPRLSEDDSAEAELQHWANVPPRWDASKH